MLKLPQVASSVFQLSALQFSRKKEEKPTRTHRLQQYFKRRVSLYVTPYHGKKNSKPTQITASKTSSTDGTRFSRAVTRSSGQTWMELWWFWGPDKGKAQPRKQDSKKQDTHLLLHLKQQNPDQNCRLSGWVILWVKDATQGWEKEFKVFASKIPISAFLPVWGLSWTSQPLPNCAKQQH